MAPRSESTSQGNSNLLPISAALLVGAASVYYLWTQRKRQHEKYPPLSSLSLLETVSEFTAGRVNDLMFSSFQRHGKTFRLNMIIPGAPTVVHIGDATDARAILKDSLNTKPATIYHTQRRFASGDNLLNLNGAEWFHRRKGINPAFAPKQVKAMNETAMQVAQKWVNETLLAAGADNGVCFDVGKAMVNITVLTICKAAFDFDITPEKGEWLTQELSLAFIEFAMKDAFNPLRRFLTWVLPERRRAFQAARNLRQFALDVIDHYKTNPSPAPQTVIDGMMKNPNYKNDLERVPDIIIMLFAGYDTTGYSLAIVLQQLALHPLEQEKLRSELTQASSLSSSCDYLKAVIQETMRLYPAVNLPGVKTLARHYTTHDGNYFIPKGSVVFMGQTVMSRDPAVFGDDPLDYRPGRWISAGDREDAMKKSQMPFSLGSRSCVGQPLANAELYTILPFLIQQFELTIEEEGVISQPAAIRLDNCRLCAKRIL